MREHIRVSGHSKSRSLAYQLLPAELQGSGMGLERSEERHFPPTSRGSKASLLPRQAGSADSPPCAQLSNILFAPWLF